MSGSQPFCNLQSVSEILLALSCRSRPKQSLHRGCPQQIWALLTHCWTDSPSDRLDARAVLSQIAEIADKLEVDLPIFIKVDDLEQLDTLFPQTSPTGSIAGCPVGISILLFRSFQTMHLFITSSILKDSTCQNSI